MKPELELLQALFAGDADRAAATFEGEPSIDAPEIEKVTTRHGLDALAAGWPDLFGVQPGAELRPRTRITAEGRAMSEALVDVAGPLGDVTLPIAVMGEFGDEGLLTAARVYYAERWVTGNPELRRTPFPSDGSESLARPEDVADVNAEYLAAVTAWDGEAIMKVFGSPCYVEFGPQRIDERERIRALYESFFGDEVKLIFNTITDDGETLVVEWTSGGPEPRAGGITAYRRDAYGRIGSIHMYDNFDPSKVPGVMAG
jgi:hypothetical protein